MCGNNILKILHPELQSDLLRVTPVAMETEQQQKALNTYIPTSQRPVFP